MLLVNIFCKVVRVGVKVIEINKNNRSESIFYFSGEFAIQRLSSSMYFDLRI